MIWWKLAFWRHSISFWIVIGILGGIACGLGLPIFSAQLGELGKLVIQLIKAIATPLLFLAIVSAILKTNMRGLDFVRFLFIALINGIVALLVGLSVSNWVQPGKYLRLENMGASVKVPPGTAGSIDFAKTLAGQIPSSIVQPFLDNAIMPAVVLALLSGFGLKRARSMGSEQPVHQSIEDIVSTLLRAVELILSWVVRLIPLAVFGVVAKSVAQFGFAPLKGLGMYVLCGLLGFAIQILIFYQGWLVFFVRASLRTFWREIRQALVYAFGCNSSLATLPLTLQALDRLGVSKASATLVACVGTNLNHDGIILYEGMALLVVVQATGTVLSIGQQLLAALYCLVAAMGVAGVPEAGFISLSLILGSLGLPTELLTLLLTVDWILARMRSVTNVLSDVVAAHILDRFKSLES